MPGRREKEPTVVAIYDLGFGEPRRVAEFRLTAEGTVALTTSGPDECLLAEDWYLDGVERDGSGGPGLIQAGDGVEFLRALLNIPPMSYYRLVDESPYPRPDVPDRADR